MPTSNTKAWRDIQEMLAQAGQIDTRSIVEISTTSDIPPGTAEALEKIARENSTTSDEQIKVSLHTGSKILEILREAIVRIERKRCGVPDVIEDGLSIQTFGSPKGRWDRGLLNVSINTSGIVTDPINLNAQQIIMNAFSAWSAAVPFFNFNFVPAGQQANIRVQFGDEALDSRFVEKGGVVGAGQYPPNGGLFFDVHETWTAQGLLSVALHEIGHVLGLSHSNDRRSVMHPFDYELAALDAESVSAAQALYGWTPQQNGPGSTRHRPALGISFTPSRSGPPAETLHMVWRGRGDDQTLWWSRFDNRWAPQQQIPGASSTHGPALTHCSDPLPFPIPLPAQIPMLVWRGRGDDQSLYWARFVNDGWEGQRNVPGASSSAAPALANVDGRVFLAWKGRDSDTGIYISEFDQSRHTWMPQARVRGVGTSDGPALAELNGKLFLFWKGVPGDENAWFSSLDLVNDPIWKPQRRVEYVDNQADGGISLAIGTTNGPSATRRGDSIVLAWKGAGDDQTLWTSFFRDGEFSGQVPVAGASSSVGPSVAQLGDRTFMAWKGRGDDQGIWWASL